MEWVLLVVVVVAAAAAFGAFGRRPAPRPRPTADAPRRPAVEGPFLGPSATVRLDDERPLGRVDALAVGGGRAVVAWTEALQAGGAEIRLRSIAADGRVSPSARAGAGSEARAGGFPVLALSGADLYVAWTDPDQDTVWLAVFYS